MVLVFVFNQDKEYLFEYSSKGIVPRQNDVLIYWEDRYKVLSVNHVINRNPSDGNYLCNIDLIVEEIRDEKL